MEKLESLLMVCGKVVSSTLVGTELVNDHLETAIHLLNGLSQLLSEILIFAPEGLKQTCFDSVCALMVFPELGPDLTGSLKVTHSLELFSAETGEKKIDCLAIPLELGYSKSLSSLNRNNVSRTLGNRPYVTALTQKILLHACFPIVIAKGFQ